MILTAPAPLRVPASDPVCEPIITSTCDACKGAGRFASEERGGNFRRCEVCDGVGLFVLAPELPTQADPGSEEKVAILCARYESGTPLFVDGDRSCEMLERPTVAVSDRSYRISIPRRGVGEKRGVR